MKPSYNPKGPDARRLRLIAYTPTRMDRLFNDVPEHLRGLLKSAIDSMVVRLHGSRNAVTKAVRARLSMRRGVTTEDVIADVVAEISDWAEGQGWGSKVFQRNRAKATPPGVPGRCKHDTVVGVTCKLCRKRLTEAEIAAKMGTAL